MTGTAYLLAVAIVVAAFVLWRYPQLREPVVRLMRPHGSRRGRGADEQLSSSKAVSRIAEAVRFECIDESVEFSHYVAVQVPEHLFDIWRTRMDKVGSAVAKEVNVRGEKFAARNRAQWRTIASTDLHYFMSVGEFEVAASFYKQKSAPSAEGFGEHGEAVFQSSSNDRNKTSIYGVDPGRWREVPHETHVVRYTVRMLHGQNEIARTRLDEAKAAVSIGRDSGNTLVVPDVSDLRGVSSRHLEISREAGGVEVTDRSTNGTFLLDGERLEKDVPTRILVPSQLSLAHPRGVAIVKVDHS
ncbi:FHA domain-containing protein [Rhodococcus sp. IEGM 1366]|uniref:FHA domain-containing protein n=1 Tax=Rhodococcus sp. IEGM 1366 TaxID=3082223 RepID=UPI002953E39C|nr:FHA domain-containing protein [Rhodococcus sp. IEGM 1366]MDV8065583.1 FHA domain-containing protein [Rhodococcus sp. IEGM 1366]